jgi:hypothetical protein
MNGVYLKLVIYLQDVQCDNFTVLAVFVPTFHLLKQILRFPNTIILFIFFYVCDSVHPQDN